MATTTYPALIDQLGLTLTIEEGPDYRRDDDDWEHHASYTVAIRQEENAAMFPWRQGLGITDDPDLATVLDSLASDAASYENASGFEDWAAEYGYDTDSRKAEAIYRAVGEQTDKLRGLLGDGEAFRMLLWETEPL